MIQWDESFSTGEMQVDEQHKTLFNFLNRLDQDIREGKPADLLKGGLAFLENYARIHFSYEELCMHRVHCPAAGENKAAHGDFLDFLEQFKQKLEKEGFTPANVAQLHVFIENWLVRHIRKVDTRLKPCMSSAKTGSN